MGPDSFITFLSGFILIMFIIINTHLKCMKKFYCNDKEWFFCLCNDPIIYIANLIFEEGIYKATNFYIFYKLTNRKNSLFKNISIFVPYVVPAYHSIGRIKWESGVNPGQSRCCKLYNDRALYFATEGKPWEGARSESESEDQQCAKLSEASRKSWKRHS